MANENPEISQKRTLLRADLSDQQSQELLKQIQRRANLPYDPSMDFTEATVDREIESNFSDLEDAFELSMGPKLMKEMTDSAKAEYEKYLRMSAEKNVRRERAKANLKIGLPTI